MTRARSFRVGLLNQKPLPAAWLRWAPAPTHVGHPEEVVVDVVDLVFAMSTEETGPDYSPDDGPDGDYSYSHLFDESSVDPFALTFPELYGDDDDDDAESPPPARPPCEDPIVVLAQVEEGDDPLRIAASLMLVARDEIVAYDAPAPIKSPFAVVEFVDDDTLVDEIYNLEGDERTAPFAERMRAHAKPGRVTVLAQIVSDAGNSAVAIFGVRPPSAWH